MDDIAPPLLYVPRLSKAMYAAPRHIDCVPPQPEVLLVPEVAEILRVSEKSVYAAIRKKKIPGAVKVGGAIRVNRAVFLAWLNGSKAP